MSDYQQLDLVRATFQPQRTDDLAPGVAEHIGARMEWEAGWIQEEGAYAGQWAFLPRDRSTNLGWVPACDLADVERS